MMYELGGVATDRLMRMNIAEAEAVYDVILEYGIGTNKLTIKKK